MQSHLCASMEKLEMATTVHRFPHPAERTPDAIAAIKKEAKNMQGTNAGSYYGNK